MSETHAPTEPTDRAPAAEQPEQTMWQTPDHVVVDTALEVTGYSLNSR